MTNLHAIDVDPTTELLSRSGISDAVNRPVPVGRRSVEPPRRVGAPLADLAPALTEQVGGGRHVAMITEGTYPFSRGGVSVWCDQVVRLLGDHRF
ncbi:MAG TPA: DUF3492 domain-containing protein, partial [Acidimicrobiales bacterium]